MEGLDLELVYQFLCHAEGKTICISTRSLERAVELKNNGLVIDAFPLMGLRSRKGKRTTLTSLVMRWIKPSFMPDEFMICGVCECDLKEKKDGYWYCLNEECKNFAK